MLWLMVKTFLTSQLKVIWKHKNIGKIANVQGDDYTILWLLDYSYLKDYHKMIAIDLSKQRAIAADPKPTQQINFT